MLLDNRETELLKDAIQQCMRRRFLSVVYNVALRVAAC